MNYKDYEAIVEFDDVDLILHGSVINIRDVISFEGSTVKEIEKDFHEAVDAYLKLCAERNENPDKPFSGKFTTRVEPDLHRDLYIAAMSAHKSLNALVEELLEAGVRRRVA